MDYEELISSYLSFQFDYVENIVYSVFINSNITDKDILSYISLSNLEIQSLYEEKKK